MVGLRSNIFRRYMYRRRETHHQIFPHSKYEPTARFFHLGFTTLEHELFSDAHNSAMPSFSRM